MSVLHAGSGDGSGDGYGDGDGSGYGSSYGDGYGYGYPEQELGGARCKAAGFAAREGIQGATFCDLIQLMVAV